MTAATAPAIPGLHRRKDGSLSLTVEYGGGVISPAILAAAARVAETHQARIHFTVAQKLMLLGLDDTTGPLALAALEQAGATVRKARQLSQPRVCVGQPACPMALQETFAFADKLYENLGRMPIPPKIKVSVSGCPACCSWANLADIGFIGQRYGFKVLIGGHGGYRPRVGEEAGRVTTAAEAVEVLRRATELFCRETEKRGRMSRVVQALGMETIKQELGF